MVNKGELVKNQHLIDREMGNNENTDEHNKIWIVFVNILLVCFQCNQCERYNYCVNQSLAMSLRTPVKNVRFCWGELKRRPERKITKISAENKITCTRNIFNILLIYYILSMLKNNHEELQISKCWRKKSRYKHNLKLSKCSSLTPDINSCTWTFIHITQKHTQ